MILCQQRQRDDCGSGLWKEIYLSKRKEQPVKGLLPRPSRSSIDLCKEQFISRPDLQVVVSENSQAEAFSIFCLAHFHSTLAPS